MQGVPTDVEVNLTPDEVEGLDEAALKALYDEKVRQRERLPRVQLALGLRSAKGSKGQLCLLACSGRLSRFPRLWATGRAPERFCLVLASLCTTCTVPAAACS